MPVPSPATLLVIFTGRLEELQYSSFDGGLLQDVTQLSAFLHQFSIHYANTVIAIEAPTRLVYLASYREMEGQEDLLL